MPSAKEYFTKTIKSAVSRLRRGPTMNKRELIKKLKDLKEDSEYFKALSSADEFSQRYYAGEINALEAVLDLLTADTKDAGWIVRVGEKLIYKSFEDAERVSFIIDDGPGSIEQATIFPEEQKAERIANEVGGTVEPVEVQDDTEV